MLISKEIKADLFKYFHDKEIFAYSRVSREYKFLRISVDGLNVISLNDEDTQSFGGRSKFNR